MELVRSPVPTECLHEQSVKIALDYLAGIGKLTRPQQAFEYIGKHIAQQMRDGQQSALVLSNKAIIAYLRFVQVSPSHILN